MRITREIIKSEIAYEGADGIHTFTMCECGRQGCRGTRCLECWEEQLKVTKK